MSSDFKHNHKSIRLQGYDYSLQGWYYITICTKDREHLFGEICDGVMILNENGELIEKEIQITETIRPNILIDSYCIMPNHIHLIVILEENEIDNRVENFQPLQNTYQKIIPHSIRSIIKGLKIGVTKWYKQNINKSSVWQRNYFEHIIRNDAELQKIRWYICNNPLNWHDDEYENI